MEKLKGLALAVSTLFLISSSAGCGFFKRSKPVNFCDSTITYRVHPDALPIMNKILKLRVRAHSNKEVSDFKLTDEQKLTDYVGADSIGGKRDHYISLSEAQKYYESVAKIYEELCVNNYSKINPISPKNK